MLDLSLSALTKAWVTTVIASGLLLVAFSAAQFHADEVYWQTFQRAVQLTGEHPAPDIDGLIDVNSDDELQTLVARTGDVRS